LGSFPDTPKGDLPYHVVYRKGSTPEDRAAWNLVQKHKWIQVHGLDFVPDVVMFRHRVRTKHEDIDPSTVLPVEIKLVKKASCSSELARGVGQCLAYNTRYPNSILFVGVNPGVYRSHDVGERGLRRMSETENGGNEQKFAEMLLKQQVRLILREVGTPQ